MTEGENLRLLAGTKLLAISLANDDEAKALAENIGAAKFLDKMNLSRELIPAILELAPQNSGFVCRHQSVLTNPYSTLVRHVKEELSSRTKVFDVLTQNFQRCKKCP